MITASKNYTTLSDTGTDSNLMEKKFKQTSSKHIEYESRQSLVTRAIVYGSLKQSFV